MSDSEQQGTCQHAISPPFGHSNTQGRTGHCCSLGGLLAPTWPRRSPTLPLFWQFRGLNPIFLLPRTDLTEKQKGREGGGEEKPCWPSLAHQVEESSFKRAKEEEEKVICSGTEEKLTAPWSGRDRRSQKDESYNSSAERSRSAFSQIFRRHTHGLKDIHIRALHSCCIHISTDHTHPDMWNLFILSIFMSSIHHRASKCECVCLHGRDRAKEGKKWRVHACMH